MEIVRLRWVGDGEVTMARLRWVGKSEVSITAQVSQALFSGLGRVRSGEGRVRIWVREKVWVRVKSLDI